MLIDSHCHLDHFFYKKDFKEVIERAKKAKVKYILTNGIDYETNLLSLELQKKFPEIIKVALGFYPPEALDREYKEENAKGGKNITSKKTIEDNLKLIEKNKNNILAIGEIGLDMHNGKNLKQQIEDLKKLIVLAINLNKPIILHTRKAEKETLDLLEEYKNKITPEKIILHCFTAKIALVERAIKQGYTFSIPTNLVRSESFQALIKLCPLNQILTETDGPYLSPYKNADNSFNRNEPSYIAESIKAIAKIKNIAEEQTENQIFDNFQRIFSLKD